VPNKTKIFNLKKKRSEKLTAAVSDFSGISVAYSKIKKKF
jgi:hypothetical protein